MFAELQSRTTNTGELEVPNRQSVTYIDYSAELSTVAWEYDPSYLAANPAAFTALQTAIDAVSLGNRSKNAQIVTNFFTNISPTNVLAQREQKLMIRYEENVSGKIFVLTIPCIDLSVATPPPGTDGSIPFTRGGGSPTDNLVDAFEAGLVVSPNGQSVTVVELRYVGRNT